MLSAPLTNKVQLKAFAGVVGVADELQPHGAGGGVEGGVEKLAAGEHPQQPGLVAAAVKHLPGEKQKKQEGARGGIRMRP